MLRKEDIIKLLISKNLKYSKHEHKPFFTVKDSNAECLYLEGSHTKNLFLKNKKNQFFLLSAKENSQIDLKKFSKSINASNLSFAREEHLINILGIKPGSVSPYALLNDKDNLVSFYLDSLLLENKKINFHPLVNTVTITVNTADFINFMIENNKKIYIYSIKDYKVIKTI